MKFSKRINNAVSSEGKQSWHNLKAAQSRRSSIVTISSFFRTIRRYLKYVFAIVSISCLAFFFKIFVFQVTPSAENGNVSQLTYLKKVLFQTDGVLDESWLSQVAPLNREMKLMEINIFEIKALIESYDQIIQAEVSREFPDTLKINLKEAKPIFKLNTMVNETDTVLKLVSLTGDVYEGEGYPIEFIKSLPYLIPYQHTNQKYLPIKGLEIVSSLLDLIDKSNLKDRIPIITVSLKTFSADPDFPGQIIEFKSLRIPRILFSAYDDFYIQIDRLNHILSYLNGLGNPDVERIDLSLKGSAAVQLKNGKIDLF